MREHKTQSKETNAHHKSTRTTQMQHNTNEQISKKNAMFFLMTTKKMTQKQYETNEN